MLFVEQVPQFVAVKMKCGSKSPKHRDRIPEFGFFKAKIIWYIICQYLSGFS